MFQECYFFSVHGSSIFFERMLKKSTMDQRIKLAVELNIFSYLLSDSNGIRTHNHLVRIWTLHHFAKLWIPLCHLNFAFFSRKESLDIQSNIECRCIRKRGRDMVITYNRIFVFKLLFYVFKLPAHDKIKLSKLYYSSDSYRFDVLNFHTQRTIPF